jgi:hypothetical protein
MQELMTQQNEILWQLEFLSNQPPLFTKAEDMLDVDVWLRFVESKFPLLTGACPDAAKTRFAAQ